jgi:hypothetical protein
MSAFKHLATALKQARVLLSANTTTSPIQDVARAGTSGRDRIEFPWRLHLRISAIGRCD